MEIDLFPGGGKYAGLFDINLRLEKDMKILDVGGGHKPHPLSTHVADFMDHQEQRHFQEINLDGRELLNGDVCETLRAFPDGFFDFCWSNHSFEHIADLPRALEEIGRTCRRGFAAFPASDLEFMTAKKHFGHVNLLRVIDGVIHIAKRPQTTIVQEMAELWEQLWKHPKFNQLFEGHGCRGYRFIWEGRIYWEGKPRYVVHEDPEEIYPQMRYFK